MKTRFQRVNLLGYFGQIKEDEVKVKVQKQKISNVQLSSLQVRAQTFRLPCSKLRQWYHLPGG
jgi:hypothetical protein